MAARNRSLKYYTGKWRRAIRGAKTKGQLLATYYVISKEVARLKSSKGQYADHKLHAAVTELFYSDGGSAKRDQTRGRRLMNLCNMDKSLIDRAVKDLDAKAKGVSISHMLLLTLVKHEETIQENQALQLKLYEESISEEAGFRAFQKKIQMLVPSVKALRPKVVINELAHAARELENRLKQFMKPKFGKAVTKMTRELRADAEKTLNKTDKVLERIKKRIDDARQRIDNVKLKLK